MTKLLSAKELLDVVRTAQADAQASGGGAKWPPRMAVGGRSGPRRRAVEQSRERDAQNVAPSMRPRGGTVPVMPAVSVPPAAAPLAAPPPPAPRPPAASRPASEPPPAIPSSGADALPPASAILAAMRAKGAGALPVPREPEPIPSPDHRVEAPPRPPSMSGIEAVEAPPSSEGRRRARTHPEPASVRAPLDSFDESSPPSAARSLAALFPPPRGPSPSVPDGTPSAPPSAPRAPQPTMPEAPSSIARSVAPGPSTLERRSSPPLAREEPEEPPPSSTVPLELPDLAVDLAPAPPLRAEPLRAEPLRAEPARPGAASLVDGQRREKTSPAAAFALGKLNPPPREPIPPPEPVSRPAASAPASPRLDVASWASSKPEWAPRSAALDAPMEEVDEGPAPVALSTDETIVLLNYDAQSSLEALSVRTGFSVFKVERIVERLMGQGVLEDLPSAPVAPAAAKARPAASRTETPSEPAPTITVEEVSPESLEGPPTEVDPRRDDGDEAKDEGEPADDEATAGEDDEEDEEAPPESAADPDDEDPAKEAELEANYRKLFETKLARLDTDERFKLAELGNGPELFALVFDKDPQVARALFDNPHFTVEHARFAAFHHPTSLGIERLVHRNDLAKDPQVQRKLLRNSHTPELVVRRILAAKRLLEIYRVTGDRDVPDRQRMVARGTLRQKFTTADPEDRLQLLWNTEGRCLTLLSGCAIDSKTTALFCARPVVSLMMVQNFAKFGATPPGMLSHFLKQNLVRRQVPLRNMLLKHPNCPSDAKKMF